MLAGFDLTVRVAVHIGKSGFHGSLQFLRIFGLWRNINDAQNGTLRRRRYTDVLGDALAGSSSMVDGRISATEKPDSPAAVPIYDPATGEGTIVISLPKESADEPHYLWVIPEGEDQKVEIIGKLPAISPGGLGPVAFSLKSGTIPHNFIITNDADGESAPPSDANTILIGPQ